MAAEAVRADLDDRRHRLLARAVDGGGAHAASGLQFLLQRMQARGCIQQLVADGECGHHGEARIADLATARYAIGEGLIDMVGMTRAHIADPHIVRKIVEGREQQIRPCVGATYCLDRIYEGGEALCIHNAATSREALIPQIAGWMLDVMPALNRLAKGKRWNTLTDAAVPNSVDVVCVEIAFCSSVYVRDVRSSGLMIGYPNDNDPPVDVWENSL